MAMILIALLQRWRAAREREMERREWRLLDDRTLRDLGLSRGELDSWAAEERGLAPVTRRRVRAGALAPCAPAGVRAGAH
ncbi:DUF1127 domain-containing protein [Caenimonas aquaedulcis]|uniref:DUF1127 domain-containing protein n=1 Tax=Caenimonas aquaedulcis TaxID=2793270 RepID=A0A931H8E9_9BURK|nr:DUF1127 domain-containing protein [Caenimonas aquaedulcis]MBG9390521.1 DUF1127 domain-containing protein [Caenimonas aquaedulcis]